MRPGPAWGISPTAPTATRRFRASTARTTSIGTARSWRRSARRSRLCNRAPAEERGRNARRRLSAGLRRAVRVAAPAPAVWAALHRADFAGAWYVRVLLALRGLRRPAQVHRLTLDRLVAGGLLRLGGREGRGVALRLGGRVWMAAGGRGEGR